MNKSYRDLFIFITIIWFLVHGIRSTFDFAVHDGIGFYTLEKWQIFYFLSLSRYTEALLMFINNGSEPIINSILSIIFLFGISVLLKKLFKLNNLKTLIVAFVFIANPYVGGYYGVYRNVDTYFLYMFCITYSIFLITSNYKINIITIFLSSLLLVIAIGVTAVSIQYFFGLLILTIILDYDRIASPFSIIIKAVTVFTCACILHIILSKCLTNFIGINIDTKSYNGIGSLFIFKDFSIINAIKNTYIDFWNHYNYSTLFLNKITRYLAISCLFISIVIAGLNIYIKKGKIPFCYFMILVITFPFLANCTYWLTNGVTAPT